MAERYLGIDLGAETVKIVRLVREGNGLSLDGKKVVEHHKEPGEALRTLLVEFGWSEADGAAATGRMSRMLDVPRIPSKAALAKGAGHVYPDHNPGTIVSIGSHGFSVLELRGNDHQQYRENSRCSQGTGNFLRQLVERFDMTVEQASEMAAGVEKPAALSGRCPVILKTDMTHLANKGEDRSRILAGLYDAVCENVQVLVKPRLSPPKVILAGGVVRAPRVQNNFRRFLESRDMRLVDTDTEDTLYLEAIGAALLAAEGGVRKLPEVEGLIHDEHDTVFEEVPSLKDSLPSVKRMAPIAIEDDGKTHRVVLGFDMGSTGSKALAIDLGTKTPVWEGYINTLGNPVAAAHRLAKMFLDETEGRHDVVAIGATGSGREIVGSLMSSCFGADPVFVLNEIAAHAEGATYFDPAVDTIFEIGGQDAKYVRLDGGRIFDAAMNEACSAGTGSFIEEQGNKFQGIDDVVQMGKVALEADYGISLGQHCSVFMAEVIDEAVAVGKAQAPILAGIYDSIIQNYLNRVKGNRSVGQRIFCQGMPFMSDALAAAVARQTGRQVIVPPNPGTIGALGIALLAVKELDVTDGRPLDLARFLTARIDSKDTFVCRSTKGCGGSGNKCRIDRIKTTVAGTQHKFVWGGNCSLYDSGTQKRKLPDRSPDPFRERRELIGNLIEDVSRKTGKPVVAMTDEFALKSLFPYFATFVRKLGFDIQIRTDGGQSSLKRGIEESNVPWCAPMQLYQGLMAELIDDQPDFLLAPRVRDLPRQKDEVHATTCPIVQGAPDLIKSMMSADCKTKVVVPRVDMRAGNLQSEPFLDMARQMAIDLGREAGWQSAHSEAYRVQARFDHELQEIGRRSLEFARAHHVTPVVVLGRAYTIYNDVLNSNVPNLLREQGALAIPVDTFPIDDDVPMFYDLYWGYGQTNIRAAHQIRREDDVYAVYCSNYSCGPDSFNLHFFSYVMENKPFAIIETDGHSGDAGTKTRIEAFLFCVDGDRRLGTEERAKLKRNNFKAIEVDKIGIGDVKRREELLLIPRMGPSAETLVEVFNSEGIRAESLPLPTRDELRTGRKYTSGKECVPMTVTLGSLLERISEEKDSDERFAFFMPTADGPCRFGVYNLVHKIILEKTGWKDRVRIVAPSDQDYFADVAPDFQVRAFVGMVADDLLLAALHDVRPVELIPGKAQEVYDRYHEELLILLRNSPSSTLVQALSEMAGGMYGIRNLVQRAAAEFRAVRDFDQDKPVVSMVGEIYVRLDPFANDFLPQKLEARGLKVHLAPFSEWLEYTTYTEMQRIEEKRSLDGDSMAKAKFTYALELAVAEKLYNEMAEPLRWGPRLSVEQALEAAEPYVSKALMGEAPLTLGGPLHEYRHGHIDGVVSIGPHECMPNKVAEAQFATVGEDEGLISLTIPTTGDPLDGEILDRFAFEVRQRYALRGNGNGNGNGNGDGKKAKPAVLPKHFPDTMGALMRTAQSKMLLSALKTLRPLSFFSPRAGQSCKTPDVN